MLRLLKIYSKLPDKEKQQFPKSATGIFSFFDMEEKLAEDTSRTTVDISDNYLSILKWLLEVKYMEISGQSKLSKKRERMIKSIETKAEKLFKVITDLSVVAKFDDYIALATVYHNLAVIYIEEKQQLLIAEKYYTRVIELLDEKELDSKAILGALEARYAISYILKSSNPQKRYELLTEALKLYLRYNVDDDNYLKPVEIATILGINKIENDPSSELEEVHAMILDDLSHMYDCDLRDKDYYVEYMHHFLKKLIEINLSRTYLFSSRVAELSIYFAQHNRIAEAHNHLAFATYIMEKWYKIKLGHESLHWTQDNLAKANLQLGVLWGEYTRTLLRISKDKFLQIESGNKICQTSYTASESFTKFEESTNLLLFSYAEDEIEMSIPCITKKYVLSCSEGIIVLDILTRWLKRVKLICANIKDFSNYFNIVLSICVGYKYLICFKPNIDTLVELYNRQLEIIKEIKEITAMVDVNKNCTCNDCKLIWLELAITNNIFVDALQEHFLSTGEKETSETLTDMQVLLGWSLNYFEKYFAYS